MGMYCKDKTDSMTQKVPDYRGSAAHERHGFISLILQAIMSHALSPADPPNGNGRALAYST
jgi:hypothetical protein